jgi:alanyl-tRNA synthetase
VHFTDELPKFPASHFHAYVAKKERDASARNHSATHLLHEALREVLGIHVEQKGSLVSPDHLRFDFSHFSKLSEEELHSVEAKVNEHILQNIALNERRNMPIEEAKETGALMLFGEKYGDLVRVIQFGDSVELCGGTHVQATGNIGYFKITHESAVAAGIRRIEAVSGERASEYIHSHLTELISLKGLLKNPADSEKALSDLIAKNNELSKSLEKFEKAQAGDVKKDLVNKIQDVNGVQFLAERVAIGPSEIKDIAFQLRAEYPRLFALLGSDKDNKPTITCFISDELVKEKGLNAGAVVKTLAKHIQGGGGGQPFFATAGGKNVNGLDEAIKNAVSFIS